jgi:hypothetical protein
MINHVDDDRVEIVSMEDESINKINSTNGDYVGSYFDLGIKFIGLQESIKIIYNRIKETI